VRIAYHMTSSPVGLLFLARSEKGLRYLEFMDRRSIKRMIAAHEAATPGAKWEPSLLDLKETVDQLEAFFNGMLRAFELPLDMQGSDFQIKVWKALTTIPYGETRTYGQIAKTIGQPKASRAVGLANNQNPIAIVVPCHRVVGADGSLTGYGGGLPKKRWLLDHEARHNLRAATAQELFAGTAQREGRAPRGR
jgi:methylated-DNA-[protein]-cysteine S-methyltransferase